MAKKLHQQKNSERQGNLLYNSKLTIEYFISIEDVIINDTPRKILKYSIVSEELPKGSVEFSAMLPNLSGDAMDIVADVETEWARVLCVGFPVVMHAVNLLKLGCESVASKTAMLDRVSQGGDPVKLRQTRNRENRKSADRAAEKLRREAALILEVPDGRKSDYLFPMLPIMHDRLKPLWRGAQEIARSAQRSRVPERRKAWVDEVQAFFQKHGFSDVAADLIVRLDTPHNWPDDLAVTLNRHGGDTKPYDIALEHAARISAYPGYLPYALTIRQLKSHLREWKKWLRELEARRPKMSEITVPDNFTH